MYTQYAKIDIYIYISKLILGWGHAVRWVSSPNSTHLAAACGRYISASLCGVLRSLSPSHLAPPFSRLFL